MTHHQLIRRKKATYWVTNMNMEINSRICNSTKKGTKNISTLSQSILTKNGRASYFPKQQQFRTKHRQVDICNKRQRWRNGGTMHKTNKLGNEQHVSEKVLMQLYYKFKKQADRSHLHVSGFLKVDNDLTSCNVNFSFKKQLRYFLLTGWKNQRQYRYIAYSPCDQEFKGLNVAKMYNKSKHI